MKKKAMEITTKAAMMFAMAGIMVGASSTIARADDGINECNYEEPIYAELVPEAQFINDYDKTEYISEDGYEPIIQTEMVSDAPVIIDNPEPEPEITYNDGETIRAQMVPNAQMGPDAPVIINELVPEKAPVIVNGPLLHKELVPNAPVILGAAPEGTEVQAEQEKVTPAETEVTTKESKPKKRRLLPDTYEEIPHYGEIKQCYFDKGSGVAFWTFIYYHPTPLGYDVIEHIEKEVREGNRGYTINGVYYDCPEHDPYFANDPYYANKRI